jgi:hypothetical protein
MVSLMKHPLMGSASSLLPAALSKPEKDGIGFP